MWRGWDGFTHPNCSCVAADAAPPQACKSGAAGGGRSSATPPAHSYLRQVIAVLPYEYLLWQVTARGLQGHIWNTHKLIEA